jgi:hypothetical protein
LTSFFAGVSFKKIILQLDKEKTFKGIARFFKGSYRTLKEGKMKRLWLILLSVGLVMAVSAPAFALDVKFSGSFYAAGMYLDKTNLRKVEGSAGNNPSTAFYFQRLRLQTDFVVAPGLSLITRFDAMERAWGAPRTSPSPSPDGIDWFNTSAGTTAENENIAFDRAYIQYASPIGIFTVGYQNHDAWGTVFGDTAINGASRGKIGWLMKIGDWSLLAQIVKYYENNKTAKNPGVVTTDLDDDQYIVGAIYNWKSGEAGMRYTFYRNAIFRTLGGTGSSLFELNSVQPYFKAKLGPVAIQAELDYYWGYETAEDGHEADGTFRGRRQAIDFFLDAVADFNMFYIGGTFAYLSGDDPSTPTTSNIEGGTYLYYGGATGGGVDWNPCLIMFNFDRTYWAGWLSGYGDSNGSPMNNAWFFQLRGGVRPVAALDIMASVSYAFADQKPSATWLNKTYGWEFDITGTYKITNNLSYMLGVGYLLTGDYFKGTNALNDVRDDYLVINKLTLTF